VVIGSIDKDDVDSGFSQRLGGIEAAESSTDDDYLGLQSFSHSFFVFMARFHKSKIYLVKLKKRYTLVNIPVTARNDKTTNKIVKNFTFLLITCFRISKMVKKRMV